MALLFRARQRRGRAQARMPPAHRDDESTAGVGACREFETAARLAPSFLAARINLGALALRLPRIALPPVVPHEKGYFTVTAELRLLGGLPPGGTDGRTRLAGTQVRPVGSCGA